MTFFPDFFRHCLFLVIASLAGSVGAQQFSCAGLVLIEISAPDDSMVSDICTASGKAIAFLNRYHLQPKRVIKIEIVEGVIDSHGYAAYGSYDRQEDLIQLISLPSILKSSASPQMYDEPFDREHYHGAIAHEITHAIFQHNTENIKEQLTNAAQEYLAHSTQMAVLSVERRSRIIAANHFGPWESGDSISVTYMGLNPTGFAVKSYLHLTQNEDPATVYHPFTEEQLVFHLGSIAVPLVPCKCKAFSCNPMPCDAKLLFFPACICSLTIRILTILFCDTLWHTNIPTSNIYEAEKCSKLQQFPSVTAKESAKKTFNPVKLIPDFGLEGDAHGGKWHRQVSFLAQESITTMRDKGLDVVAGNFAENITTEGLDLTSLTVGTHVRIGESELVISQLGKICHTRCAIYHQAGDCVMPREGIFGVVLKGGTIRVGDTIEVQNKFSEAAAIISTKEIETSSGDELQTANQKKNSNRSLFVLIQ